MPTRAETKALTREALLLAALTLFTEEGMEGPSLDSICERAGRTRGAFYVHFPTREALNLAVMERVLQDYFDVLSGTETLSASIDRFADILVRAAENDPTLPPFVRLGTRHFHLVLDTSSRDANARAALSTLITTSVRMLSAQASREPHLAMFDEGLGEVLATTLIGLMSFPDGGAERIRRIQHTLRALLSVPPT